jgi:chorismate mutase/prephenate dehydratase
MSASKDAATDLDQLRQRIDTIDEQLQALISERARLAQAVGRAKGATSPADF